MDKEEISPDYQVSEDFDRDSISWVTDDVAITSVNGAEEALLEEGYFVINVAEEILNDAHARIPVGFSSRDTDRQRQTVDLIAGVIEGVLHYTDHKVVVHCQQGMVVARPQEHVPGGGLRTHPTEAARCARPP